jgi:tetratricopeptide (TPR) repeat protein
MPPELLGGEKAAIPTDIYSAGAVLYEMLAGVPPYQARSLPELLQKVAREEPLPVRSHNAKIPEAVADLVGRAISRHVGERPQTAEDFARMLRVAVRGRATSRIPVPSRSGIHPPIFKKRRWPWFVGAGAVIVAAGVTLSVKSEGLSQQPSPVVATPESPRWTLTPEDGALEIKATIWNPLLRNFKPTEKGFQRLQRLQEQRRAASLARPDDARARADYARVMSIDGMWSGVQEELAVAAELSPKSATIQCNLGTALLKLNRLPAARTAYERAMALEPDLPEPVALLVHVLNLQRDGAGADRMRLHLKGRFSTKKWSNGWLALIAAPPEVAERLAAQTFEYPGEERDEQ